jgi:hypothetical protein
MFTIKIVINHYEKNLEWVKDLKYPYIIYNKNENEKDLFDFNLPNLGFDTIVYLRFIVDNYTNLPDYVAFLQDDPKYHCIDVVDRINNFDFKSDFLPLSAAYILGNHDFEKTYNFAEKYGINYEKPIKMIASCQCIVSKNLILRTPLETYNKLISSIDKHVKSQENYCIENLWPTILNFNNELLPGCHYCSGYPGGC